MVVDIFTYNGEAEMLDLHLNILAEYVDKFVIVESTKTFTGKDKKLYYPEVMLHYTNLPIRYYVVDEDDEDLWELAKKSPNTLGAEHWKREFVQKESIKKAINDFSDDTLCFIGDVDEIWRPNILLEDNLPKKLKLDVSTYFVNNRSTEQFWGTFVCTYGFLKDKCINHLRSSTEFRTADSYGWHFTSMGGIEEFKRKLEDSYTEESYYTEQVKNNIDKNYGISDFLGRGFGFWKGESTLPEYLLNNREKYAKLFC